jgi:predicted N-formylglutamate amidohydrolase
MGRKFQTPFFQQAACALLLSCEHGGNRVPRQFAELFHGRRRLLDSHRGYDAGALDLARRCARQLETPLIHATVTRLLIDLNRSLHHRRVFSEITAPLPEETKAAIIADHYLPYRGRVQQAIERLADAGRVVHVSVHSFTPVLGGLRRTADVGLLYDPSRPGEAAFAERWKQALAERRGDLRVRRNYPYLGKADGLTTALRKRDAADRYVGIELEVNRALYRPQTHAWLQLQDDLIATLSAALHESAV